MSTCGGKNFGLFARLVFGIAIGFCCLLSLTSPSLTAAQTQPTIGITQRTYRGAIRPTSGQAIPFMLRIFRSSSERDWAGAFILGDEAGPYPLTKVTYDPIGDVLTFKSKGPQQAPDGGLSGTLKAKPNHALSGRISSWRGDLGVLELTLDQNASFSTTPLLQGNWSGQCIDSGQGKNDVQLVIIDMPPPQGQKTENLDLPWTPWKSGSFFIYVTDNDLSRVNPAATVSAKGCAVDYITGKFGCNMQGAGAHPIAASFQTTFTYTDRALHDFKLTTPSGKTTACEQLILDKR